MGGFACLPRDRKLTHFNLLKKVPKMKNFQNARGGMERIVGAVVLELAFHLRVLGSKLHDSTPIVN